VNPSPGREYLCEHVGVMNTISVTGRVRFRGIFEDPNELAWSLSVALPFVFAWFERRRVTRGGMQVGPAIVTLLVLAACVYCNIMTKSRSGQISLIATLGVYFLNRFRWKGLALGAALAVPIMMLGGRSDDSSTQERLECWSAAMSLWREHPLTGVGGRQFVQYHYLTAHNSVMLAVAETGPVGVVLLTAVVYAAFKMTLRAQRQLAGLPEAAEARAVAFATVAALTGTVASCFFLSITYHVAFWVVLGLAGAVHAMVARHDPDWHLPWSMRDTAIVLGLDIAILTFTALYLKSKGL
jgi:O-antigen ligase